ncbi:MAG: aminopeptidase [Bacillota bacterium]
MDELALKFIVEQLISHSLKLRSGDKLFIDNIGSAEPLLELITDSVKDMNVKTYVFKRSITDLKKFMNQDEHLISGVGDEISRLISESDAYLGIRAEENIFEFGDISADKMQKYNEYYAKPVQMAMASLDRWTLIRNPTYGMAQLASVSLQQMWEVFHESCRYSYDTLSDKAAPLKSLMEKTDKVHIRSVDTDLEFSIKDIPVFLCDGLYNLPDGEIFTAPVIDSIQGKIAFNVPSMIMNHPFEKIKLTFHNGRVVDCESSDLVTMKQIINSDDGASRVGEFGIGLNQNIKKPINNLIFDEKMAGSIHLALGMPYDMANNGNISSIHWDMVLCLHKEYGGGEVYFDGKLIQKDGEFILPELRHLNG